MQIRIGTSGWSYPRGEGTWKGYFYPPGTINELEYYSRFFATVEINTSFYRPLDPQLAERWSRMVPANFIFAVKLWQKFTHPAMFESATGEAATISRDDVVLFERGIAPLVRAGKLGAILAQFPPSFKNDTGSRDVLSAVLDVFGRYRIAVELRHRSWSDDTKTAALLEQHNASWVQIDEPKFASSVAPVVPVTADMVYFRFHGRNAADWWTGNNETRYKYLYSPVEIGELARQLKPAAAEAGSVLAFFNNHWRGFAPRNALDLMRAMEMPG